jgi:hypothetical protein
MTGLSILTLSTRDPIPAGSVRYMLGTWDDVAGEYGVGQYVIIVEPVTPDRLPVLGLEEGTGSVAVITDDGLAVVPTVGLGVLVLPTE